MKLTDTEVRDKLIGTCRQCRSKVNMVNMGCGHKMDCSYGNQLYLVEHPEVAYWSSHEVNRILKIAITQGWIIVEEEHE